MVASTLDPKNRDLSAIAVVSAVADRQDQGEKKSLVGLNAEILKSAQSLGIVSTDLDIILSGRETSPVYDALAYSLFHYIDGLTWNREACYLLLKNAGIRLRNDNGSWQCWQSFHRKRKPALLKQLPSLSLHQIGGYPI